MCVKLATITTIQIPAGNAPNKAHKAKDASSWWWNDCMMMWLHEIRLGYLLLQLYARKWWFSLFFTKALPTHGPTDRPTDRRTDPFIDARTHLKRSLTGEKFVQRPEKMAVAIFDKERERPWNVTGMISCHLLHLDSVTFFFNWASTSCFLDASSHLYMRSCPSVSLLVRRMVTHFFKRRAVFSMKFCLLDPIS